MINITNVSWKQRKVLRFPCAVHKTKGYCFFPKRKITGSSDKTYYLLNFFNFYTLAVFAHHIQLKHEYTVLAPEEVATTSLLPGLKLPSHTDLKSREKQSGCECLSRRQHMQAVMVSHILSYHDILVRPVFSHLNAHIDRQQTCKNVGHYHTRFCKPVTNVKCSKDI